MGRERNLALQRLYDDETAHDLSRDVLQGAEAWLRLVEVAPCGWTDLGTPERVNECLSRSIPTPVPRRRSARRRPLLVLGPAAPAGR
ncbi:MAG: hypothetical protein H6835_14630 [Planctomycetes bacterium]|nr:hypothetical protein [Planctomycetota bacterium]